MIVRSSSARAQNFCRNLISPRRLTRPNISIWKSKGKGEAVWKESEIIKHRPWSSRSNLKGNFPLLLFHSFLLILGWAFFLSANGTMTLMWARVVCERLQRNFFRLAPNLYSRISTNIAMEAGGWMERKKSHVKLKKPCKIPFSFLHHVMA